MSLTLGLDVGSTTVKAVVWDDGRIRFSDYRRHNADVRGELALLLRQLSEEFPDCAMPVAVTGSGGLQVAELMGADFVQEVIASTEAVQQLLPIPTLSSSWEVRTPRSRTSTPSPSSG